MFFMGLKSKCGLSGRVQVGAVMLAGLVMTARSCFIQWRQTDGTEPTCFTSSPEPRKNWSRTFFFFFVYRSRASKVLCWTLEELERKTNPSSCHFEGPKDFFLPCVFLSGPCELKLFLVVSRCLVKQTLLRPSGLTLKQPWSGLFEPSRRSLLSSGLVFPLFFECVAARDDVTDATFP